MASIANFFLMALLILLAISKQALPRKSKSENADVKQLEFLLSEMNPGQGSSSIEPDRSPPPNIPSSTPYTGSDEYIPGEDHTMVPNFGYSALKAQPRLNVPFNTPYTSYPPKKSPQYSIQSFASVAPKKPPVPYTGIASKESPQYKSNTPYAGISLKESPLKKSDTLCPPKRSPQNNIPPSPYILYPQVPPKQSVQNNIPSYTAYASIAPKTPHLSIPSYIPYTGSDRYIPKRLPRLGVPAKTPYTGIPPSPHNNIPSYTSYIRGEDDIGEPDPDRVSFVPAADRP
ncbi:hypothetical protein M5689_012219 [Euphorbia peplus]|nr:hypothetical protein M5689_012219 [Euphorbia peplus]